MPVTEQSIRKQLAAMGEDFKRLNSYRAYRLMEQARVQIGLLAADMEIFTALGVGVTIETTQTLQSLLKIMAAEGADQIESSVDIEKFRNIVDNEMDEFAQNKKEVLLWAKASGLSVRLFNINMGQGSIQKFRMAAEIFEEILVRKKDQFVYPQRIASIIEENKNILQKINQARVARGLEDLDLKEDNLTVKQAKRLLYDTMLKVSRLGQAVFFKDPGKSDAYRMTLLQPIKHRRHEVQDDDAPVIDPAVASEIGVALPAEG